MTLVVAFKGTDGIVLAADSRVTLMSQQGHPSTFDNATKLLTLGQPHNRVGAVTSGVATFFGRTHHSLMPEFEATLGQSRLSVLEYAQKLSDFFQTKWQASGQSVQAGDAEFTVCGYDLGDIYGKVFRFTIPRFPAPAEVNPGIAGLSWGGQSSIVNRILLGYDLRLMDTLRQHFSFNDQQVASVRQHLSREIQHQIPYDTLALQDCVDLATYLIRTTIEAQSFSTGLRGVGGEIDVATITQTEGFKWVSRKQIQGGRQ